MAASSTTAAAAAEDWATKEKFILACCVSRSGDQNWVSVSRTMKLITEACGDGEKRPPEWFSQKNCATKYNQLLNTAFATKRKVRGQNSDSINIETPAEQILRKLTFKRIEELDQAIKTERERYKKLKCDIEKIQGGLIDDQLPAIWNAIQSGQNIPLETLIKPDEPEPPKTTQATAQPVTSQATPSRPQRATKETEKFKSYIEQRQKHNAKYHHHTPTSAPSSTSPATPDISAASTTTVGPSPAQVQSMSNTNVPAKGLLTTKTDQKSVEQQQYLQQQQQQLQQQKQQQLLQQQQQQQQLQQQQLLQQQEEEREREQQRQLQLQKQEEERKLAQQKQEEEERKIAQKQKEEEERKL